MTCSMHSWRSTDETFSTIDHLVLITTIGRKKWSSLLQMTIWGGCQKLTPVKTKSPERHTWMTTQTPSYKRDNSSSKPLGDKDPSSRVPLNPNNKGTRNRTSEDRKLSLNHQNSFPGFHQNTEGSSDWLTDWLSLWGWHKERTQNYISLEITTNCCYNCVGQ